MAHPAERQYFLDKLKEKEIARQGTSVVSSLMATSFERNFFELSLNFATVHREWVKSHPRPRNWITQAQRALTGFVMGNPSFLGNDVVMKLRNDLKGLAGAKEGRDAL